MSLVLFASIWYDKNVFSCIENRKETTHEKTNPCSVALLTGCSRKETTGQWPSQKIEIDVCYTAGGTADTVARQLSALMSQQLSTTFNLVNVTGGSGSIAGQQV